MTWREERHASLTKHHKDVVWGWKEGENDWMYQRKSSGHKALYWRHGMISTVAEHQVMVMAVVESTCWSPTQGTGLSESLGGGLSGGGFCRTPLGNSVGGRVLCHKVCSQCCKLAQEAYSRVRDKSREVSAHRQRWGWRSGKNKANVVTQMNDRKQKRNKAEWDVAERGSTGIWCK